MGSLLAAASTASAQPLGAFRWQLQPFCNVVTLTIVQEGGSLLLTGTDDMCGLSAAAPATGTAVVKPDGNLTLGFIVITPTGPAAHVSATFSGVTLAGMWRDADGHVGPLHFNPDASPSGSPRPVPTTSSVITAAQLAPTIFSGTGAAATVAHSDHAHDDRYYTKAQIDAGAGASSAEVIVGAGIGVPATLQIQELTSANTESIVTSKAGRLLVTKSTRIGIDCGTGNGAFYFLVLDGAPVRSSATFAVPPLFSGQLTGATSDVVAAGAHTLRVGAQCFVPANFSGGFTETLVGISSVVVLP